MRQSPPEKPFWQQLKWGKGKSTNNTQIEEEIKTAVLVDP